MLKRNLLIIFLLGFLAVNGFSQPSPSDKQLLDGIREIIRQEMNGENSNPEPLTWNDIGDLKKDERAKIIENLEYYLSSDIVVTTSIPVRKEVSGKLETDHGDTVTKKIISKTNKGKYGNFVDDVKGKEYFEIIFGDIPIRFYRNIQTGNFTTIVEGTLTSLCVFKIEKGAMKPRSNTNSQRSQTQILNTRQFLGGSHEQDSIIGRGTLSRDVIVSYIYSRNSKPLMSRSEINILVNEYINEAMREGVNHDIAIAQMCYATGFLGNNKILNTYNFGGLNTDKGISVKYGNRHMSMQEGVWAHIQHLKGYASYERPKREIVDRRYYLLADSGIIGTITTLDSLFATWAPYNSVYYGNDIRRILNDMYRLSNRNI